MATSRTTPLFLGLVALSLMGARGGCERPTHVAPPSPCEDLAEDACVANTACAPEYVRVLCDCEDDRLCDCPPPSDDFIGCHERDRCQALSEFACQQTPGCRPIYGGGGGCACAPCPPGAECEPCDCPPIEERFESCVAVSPCEGLGEAACASTPGCAPSYAYLPCPMLPCIEGEDCGNPCSDEPGYAGCYPVEPPPAECTSDADCAPGDVCVQVDCLCPACHGPGCPDCDCASGGQCVPGKGDRCEGAALDAMGNCLGAYDQPLPADCCDRACDQVITYAADPETGTCYAFPTPCDVPEGWKPCPPR